jgi:hypothetical protein
VDNKWVVTRLRREAKYRVAVEADKLVAMAMAPEDLRYRADNKSDGMDVPVKAR